MKGRVDKMVSNQKITDPLSLLGVVYERYRKNKNLTDLELDFLIKELTETKNKLEQLGSDHRLSFKAIQQNVECLIGFARARKDYQGIPPE